MKYNTVERGREGKNDPPRERGQKNSGQHVFLRPCIGQGKQRTSKIDDVSRIIKQFLRAGVSGPPLR